MCVCVRARARDHSVCMYCIKMSVCVCCLLGWLFLLLPLIGYLHVACFKDIRRFESPEAFYKFPAVVIHGRITVMSPLTADGRIITVMSPLTADGRIITAMSPAFTALGTQSQ